MASTLSDIAWARSGDKGDTCNIGVMARDASYFDELIRALTPDRIKAFFGDMVQGEVEVYPLPTLHSVNVVMRGALEGGATRTLRFDQTGKSMGNVLLRLPLDRRDTRGTSR